MILLECLVISRLMSINIESLARSENLLPAVRPTPDQETEIIESAVVARGSGRQTSGEVENIHYDPR